MRLLVIVVEWKYVKISMLLLSAEKPSILTIIYFEKSYLNCKLTKDEF